MSKSPSPSRSTGITPTNPSSPPSRPQLHEQSPSIITSGERQYPSPTTSYSPIHSAGPSAGPSRIRAREEDDTSEEPMAKRFHDEPSMRGRPSDRSSPSSDSQGGMADTEDAERSQQSEKSAAPSAPPKKKRTRTLTTPHQSAVLHALLAQSRFPTTAMREEVGRSIGLSARKVQIWFQNQRQKARRPRTQNPQSLSRPPQYGAFPSGPEAESVTLYPRPQQRDLSEVETRTQPGHYDDPRVYQQYPHTLSPSIGSPPQLLGPGVPGHVPSAGVPISPETSPVSGHPPSRFIREYQPYRRSPTPPRMYSLPQPRPATSHHSSGGMSFRDASRTLPPLIFPPPQSQASARYSSYPSVRSAPAHIPPPYPFRQPFSSPESVIETRPPEHQTTPTSSTLPPPITLQPRPQWNDPVFTSMPHTRSSSWSTHGSDHNTLSPTVSRVPHRVQDEPDLEPVSARGGRYDPVRATVVPYTHTTSSPSRSPRSPGSEKR